MNNIPTTMQAMVLTGLGGLDKLEFHENWPVPKIKSNEVLFRVVACGLNNTDINTRTGWYSKGVSENTTGEALDTAEASDSTWGGVPLEFPRIQGADAVGKVVAAGIDVPVDLIGQRVMVDTWLRDWSDPGNLDKMGYFGSERDGGYAQYSCADWRNIHPVKSTLSDAELATFATSYVTAEGMLNRAQVKEGDSILVTGASGGVGSALIQLAKRRGAKVVAMCSASKQGQIERLDPDAMLDRQVSDLAKQLEKEMGRRKVSVVTDVVGGEQWPTLINALERGGRYVCSGAIAGPIVPLDLRTFYLNDLTFVGSTGVPVGVFADLVSYIEAEEIKPLLAEQYPLKDLHAAQSSFVKKAHVGNIVVTP